MIFIDVSQSLMEVFDKEKMTLEQLSLNNWYCESHSPFGFYTFSYGDARGAMSGLEVTLMVLVVGTVLEYDLDSVIPW